MRHLVAPSVVFFMRVVVDGLDGVLHNIGLGLVVVVVAVEVLVVLSI